MDITQTFYNALAPQYDKLFLDWEAATQQQAAILHQLFTDSGFNKSSRILDCACGIGTQAIGLARLGYQITGADLSTGTLTKAKERAAKNQIDIPFVCADFRKLPQVFPDPFDILIAMDNALPHMLSRQDLASAVKSMIGCIRPGGILVASIRDYDALLKDKPSYSPPYIHKTPQGQRVCFQTWEWDDDRYRLIQYIIEDEGTPQVQKFECEYRATRRQELSDLLMAEGCSEVTWLFTEQTSFYQPIVLARTADDPSNLPKTL